MPSLYSRKVRSVFVSDLHLGCAYSHAQRFLRFLEEIEPDYLYLVGDIIDGWRLKRRWYWEDVYGRIFKRLLMLASRGTQVCYAPGNHDGFMRAFLHDFGWIRVADEFVHVAADDRRYLVIHGDQFDSVEQRTPWLSMLGAGIYDLLMWTNHRVNRVRRRLRLSDWRFSSRVKVSVKTAVRFISDFEQGISCHARKRNCDAVVCGHIHVPRIANIEGVVYCNAGDWVEHCTALVEYEDGTVEIVDCSQPDQQICSPLLEEPFDPCEAIVNRLQMSSVIVLGDRLKDRHIPETALVRD